MNLTRQDLSTRLSLAMLIPDTEWVLPDYAQFGAALPGHGDTDRGVPQRMRAHLRLARTPANNPHPVGTVMLDRRSELGCCVARLKIYRPSGDRYVWRRFPVDVDLATVIAAAGEVHPGPVTVITDGTTAPPRMSATPPALPLRPASTSISRMPDQELTRLHADAGDEMGRRGLLPAPMTAMSPTDAWGIVREALADLPPELLRRMAADTSAERERRREALQAMLTALG
jgi:hypothetical protein